MKWIWVNKDVHQDMYADFYTEFDFNGEKTEIELSADSNYTLYINGTFVESSFSSHSEQYSLPSRQGFSPQ